MHTKCIRVGQKEKIIASIVKEVLKIIIQKLRIRLLGIEFDIRKGLQIAGLKWINCFQHLIFVVVCMPLKLEGTFYRTRINKRPQKMNMHMYIRSIGFP